MQPRRVAAKLKKRISDDSRSPFGRSRSDCRRTHSESRPRRKPARGRRARFTIRSLRIHRPGHARQVLPKLLARRRVPAFGVHPGAVAFARFLAPLVGREHFVARRRLGDGDTCEVDVLFREGLPRRGGRGGAAATTCIFRGGLARRGGLRRRRGHDVDIPWRSSAEADRGGAAATTWIFRLEKNVSTRPRDTTPSPTGDQHLGVHRSGIHRVHAQLRRITVTLVQLHGNHRAT